MRFEEQEIIDILRQHCAVNGIELPAGEANLFGLRRRDDAYRSAARKPYLDLCITESRVDTDPRFGIRRE